MEENKIKELVFSFMDRLSITPVPEGDGTWRVQIPEKEKSFFNGNEELLFTFDRAIAENHRDLELICDGSYLLRKIIERLLETPKVSRVFALTPPSLPPIDKQKGTELRVVTAGKVYYRQQVIFNFKVRIKSDSCKEMLFSALADAAKHEIYLKKGLSWIGPEEYSETPDPDIPVEESGEEILRLYLQACRKLEETMASEIEELKEGLSEEFREELDKFREYLNEQKRELQKKRENVCFHLYFFQKEEEIDRMIRDLEAEQERKIEELKEKYALKVEINLVGAIMVCIPTIGVPASQLARKRKEATTIPMGGGNLEARPAV